jgi:F-box domain
MSFKRARSPSLLTGHPVVKKRLLENQSTQNIITFDSLSALGLADELVLNIFGHLDAVDLCRLESVNRGWQRLAGDNEVN